jgi:hypothetical protein
MLLLLGLFVLCAALVRSAEGIIIPQDDIHDKARRETLQSCEPASAGSSKGDGYDPLCTRDPRGRFGDLSVLRRDHPERFLSRTLPTELSHDGAIVAADRIGVAHQFWS